MKVIVRKIIDNNGNQIGTVLHANVEMQVGFQNKKQIEDRLIQYAHDILYRDIGIIIFREVNSDTPAITVFKELDHLPQETIEIE